MDRLRVGKPFSDDGEPIPEGAGYNFVAGHNILTLAYPELSSNEIAAVTTSEPEFALVPYAPSVLFLLFRFRNGFDWSDCAYAWHLTPDIDREPPPELKPGERAPLTVALVESTTGIVAGLRVITFTHAFTRKLYETINRQIDSIPISPSERDAIVATAYRKYPGPASMLVDATIFQRGHDRDFPTAHAAGVVQGMAYRKFGTRSVVYLQPGPRATTQVLNALERGRILIEGAGSISTGTIVVLTDPDAPRACGVAFLVTGRHVRPGECDLNVETQFVWDLRTGDAELNPDGEIAPDIQAIQAPIIASYPYEINRWDSN